MWQRNLLFFGLLAGGMYTLGANLLPPREPSRVTNYVGGAYREAEFLASVARVDESFHKQWSSDKVKPAEPANDSISRRSPAF